MFGPIKPRLKPINWRRLLAAIVGAGCTYAVTEINVPPEVAAAVCGALVGAIAPPDKKKPAPEAPPLPQ
jgi:hypothetical protein